MCKWINAKWWFVQKLARGRICLHTYEKCIRVKLSEATLKREDNKNGRALTPQTL